MFLNRGDNNKIPSVAVKDLNGSTYNTETISNNGKPIVIVFWATWCKSSVKELDEINDNYTEWQKATGLKVIAVSTDDTRSVAKVNTMVNTKGWKYEIYLDVNQDFKRAMNVNLCPHTFIIDGNKNIVWQGAAFIEGSEEELFEKILKVSKGEAIENK
jgi:cytochrome c biogenesis protein CcmG/thiol:disulfide interchange protein DsbE